MEDKFQHIALTLSKERPLIFTALSKHLFYYRMFICKFVLENEGVPLNPFMVSDYFLLDSVDRNLAREANNSILSRCDELWVFGPISDGVLAEIKQAEEKEIPIRYFSVDHNLGITPIDKTDIKMEDEVAAHRNALQ